MPLKIKKVTIPTIATSVLFNGSTQYLSLADSANLRIGTSAFCIEAWIYLNALPDKSVIFGKRTYNTTGTGTYLFLVNSTGNLLLQELQNVTTIVNATGAIQTNRWCHVAVSRDASNTVRLFVNGTVVSTATSTFNFNSTEPLWIGKDNAALQLLLNGYISNLRFVIGDAIYTSNFTPPTATLPVVTNTALLTCHDTTIRDASTNNFTITNNNTATVSTVSPFPVLRSVLFDGTSQYLTIANSSAVQLNTGNFTIEGWIYVTAFQGSSAGNDLATICDKDGIQGSTYSSYSIRCTNSSGVIKLKADCNTSSGGGTTGAVTSTTTINTGTWYHFAYVRNGATAYLYINGTQEASAGIVDFYTTTNPVYIGYENNATSRFYWPGYISNFRIVKGTAVYTSSFTASTAPLTAITSCSLLTCNDQTIRDASVNNFTVTNNNTATVSTVVPFTVSLASSMKFKKSNPSIIGRSVYFTGASQYLSTPTNVAFDPGNTGAWTLECWFYPLNTANGRIVEIGNGGAWGAALGISRENTGKFAFFQSNGSNNAVWAGSSASTYAINTWHHLAVSKDSSNNIKCFINGIEDTTLRQTNVTGTVPTNNSLRVNAANDNNGGQGSNGYTSNVRWIKGTALYTASFSVPTSPLTAITNTQLLTCNAATIIDASLNNFTITNNGTATVSSAVTPFLSTPGTFKVKKSPVVYMVATGGDLITTSGSYKVHTFTTVGTSSFTINSIGSTPSIEYLIVGGGGAGGSNNNCGGGGAGGLIYNTASLSVGAYAITIGQSGSVASGVSNGNNGGNSTFNGLIALGGGGGGGSTAGSNGGSGGGNGGGGFGGTDSGGGAGLQPTSSYGGFGNKGGFSAGASSYPGGGGGGAGAAGGNGSGANGGNGGNGKAYAFAGALTYYAGGGGGSLNPGTAGTGGLGGGGNGRSTIGVGIAATGYGSGGGGGLSAGSGGEGGAGSPGIILIKYRYTD
jgi:hypothetical protein